MIRLRSGERVVRMALLIAGDALLAGASLAVAVAVRRHVEVPWTRTLLPPEKFVLDLPALALAAASLVLCLAASGFYSARVTQRERPLLVIAVGLQTLVVAFGATLLERPWPRSLLLLAPLFAVPALALWRRALRLAAPVRPRETVLVGGPRELAEFIDFLHVQQERRIRVVGLAGPSAPAPSALPWWGDIDDPRVRDRLAGVEELIHVGPDEAEARLGLFALRGPYGYLMVPSARDALLAKPAFGWVGDRPLLEVSAPAAYNPGAALKRAFDVVVAAGAALLALPAAGAVALAILIEDGRPVLFRQTRVGRGGAPFRMWKFRTMRHAPHSGALASEGDDRVTRAGALLRRYRLDELPQLVNILCGEMSCVGPRPEVPELEAGFRAAIPGFELRTLVRPGLAGLAQVSSEYDTHASVKLRYDLAYICGWSLRLDVRILARSVATALAGRGL